MLLIAGTVPIKDLPLTIGKVEKDGEYLVIKGRHLPCTQGTAAMISAALATTDYLNLEPPHVLVAGDTGQGKGSREIYEYLISKVADISPKVLALHYCLPDMSLTRRLCESVKGCAQRPIMIADAASMYAAKAAGLAPEFDIFTPDATEIAFLADAEATHPAYIAKHLFDTDITQTPKLASMAYEHNDAARLLLVKGATDYVIRDGEILDTISEPDVPASEAIGGTGDTITGLISAFVYADLEPRDAAILATRTNRVAGHYAKATPATTVSQIIEHFPEVYKEHLCQWSGICYSEGVQQ